jgi:small-conductance mechanosensitive channel
MLKPPLPLFLFVLTMSGLLLWAQPVGAVTPAQLKSVTSQKKKGDTQEVQLPEQLESDEIDSFIATLSDAQVRRLLIEELKQKAALEAAAKKDEEKSTGLAGFIHDMRRIVAHVRDRIGFLMSGATKVDDHLPEAFGQIMEMEYRPNPLKAIAVLFLLFAGGLGIDWLFRRFTAPARRRLEGSQPPNWRVKLGRLALRSLLDFASICVLAVATLILFFIFLDDGRPMRFLILITYLNALVIVWGVRLVSNLVLSPSAGRLRLLPLKDENSRYIHKWLVALAAVGSFGWLTCGLLGLQRLSEAEHLFLVAMVGLIVALMLVVVILQKRRPVAEALLQEDSSEHSLRPHMARKWHVLAILYVFAVWTVWAFALLIVGPRVVPAAVVTIIIIPVFFLLDWGLRRLLELSTVHYHEDLSILQYQEQTTDDTSEAIGSPETDFQDDDLDEAIVFEPAAEPSMISRNIPFIRRSFRVLLATSLFFLVLKLWGIHLPLATVFTENALAVLLTLLIAFVCWQFAKAYVDRRLQEDMPEDDEEMDEGGKGGTRRGTLLVLLRKFILAVLVVMVSLIVLSALGVNIGPLIAGAGIAGIAIGFGAQTLVRDIISGVFFLVDDAFRVGDYIQAGSVRGTVEHISLRSLQLRHHRGMLQTIPFGDMQSVTNYSRDYIIMKLQFRVRYDTDVEKVRKIIKRINAEIQQDEELSHGLLSKIKSQGVREMDDSAMIMRVKFKAIPGEQFVLRREVYRRLQEAFRQGGIEFAHRNVTVYFPPESAETEGESQGDEKPADAKTLDDKKKEAAAAAAARTIQEEEIPPAKPDEP